MQTNTFIHFGESKNFLKETFEAIAIKPITLLLFLVMISFNAKAQNKQATIQGSVKDAQGEPLPFSQVFIKSLNIGTTTDMNGRYVISNLPIGTHLVTAQFVGYFSEEQIIEIKSANDSFIMDFSLEENTQELEEVQVLGKSEATQVREQSYAVEVINSKGFKNLSTNANDMLGKVSGVNIRQSGGLGSPFSLSLNGLSGKQLRVFLDGVPMDYFGSSLSLNNFSANLIERIEVYKGVVPIHLSSDALGGAINVITGNQQNTFLDASYSVGSFNTHIASLNGQYRDSKTGFTVRLKSFYNTSQNNYKVPVYLVDFETGKKSKEATWLERFHDAYHAKMGWVETGFVDVPFADQLLVGFMYSENFKEIQQPSNAIGQASIPYGEVAYQEDKVIANLSYKKSDLITEGLNVNAYLVSVFSNSISVDTSSYRYDWFGGRTLRSNTSVGEIENRKTFLNLDLENYLSNLNAEYQISDHHNLALNYSLNHMIVSGEDPYKAENNTQFSKKSTVSKQVVAAAYTQSFFDKNLSNSYFVKHYTYGVSSQETNYQGDEITPFHASKNYLGYGLTSTLHLHQFQIKASYENAIRFPELIELFGDGLNFEPNPTLLPEQSNNYNVGVLFNSTKSNSLSLSVNGFLRDADNFILPQAQGIKTFHINNGKAISTGIDLGASYRIKNTLSFSLNGTYFEKRDNNPWRNGEVGVPNSQYKIRVPNDPYFYGNFSASYRKDNIISEGDNFSTTLRQSYVHEFYYRWENLASQGKGIVPKQWTTNVDFVYSLQEGRYNLSFGIANLWDAKVYDNFQQLRPGRTFNFKIRYFIN